MVVLSVMLNHDDADDAVTAAMHDDAARLVML